MTDARLKMQDPRHQYPEPPFPEQPQPAPGLAAEMQPKPDHGETSYRGSGKLEGRKALVTGADSGIGRAAAIAFAREGADVAMVYLPQEERDAREVVELIEQAGRKAVAIPGDITDERFCEMLVQKAVKGLGGIDILVNNAGKQRTQREIGEITSEQFDATLKTNLYAMFWITKAAEKHLPEGAAVINTASVQAVEPSEALLDYATTKAGIVAFTKALAKQLIKKGVRVNAVAPGPVWTALQPSGGQTQEKVQHFGEKAPLGRPGQPVELAPVYVLLASQEASFITGEVYGVTGGEGIV
ncbi:MAG TPA: SDR family oxidoreductase [Caulobacteraceae bacterium]|nr:SDR family oxidoreductase [Caulobacteraceae bacterium]